ncbi:toprim domain-containing protein [Polaribacter ponticola]|nr:toprim domain-containing protein [Polaribacter sp. MSW5]MDD7914091.1 toprim domain-containing protein [Polaribacter sp. MSW5]
MNDSGGLEITNIISENFRKICLGKKEITTINNNSKIVSIFESWSDFLSYLTIKKQIPKENFIILNSTSMVSKVTNLLIDYDTIKLFFDNDNAGNKATAYLKMKFKNSIIDNRIHYKNYNDLNEYLTNIKQ